MAVADGFVEALLAAPAGVALLARLDVGPGAVEAVQALSFGDLVRTAVWSAHADVGPWVPRAPDVLADAYRQAERRRPIAEALAATVGDELHRPMDAARQEHWTSEAVPFSRPGATDPGFESVYGAGQFAWDALWTVTAPPEAAHDELVWAWELNVGGAVRRYRLPVDPSARVFEVHRPEDWVRLVNAHPRPATPGQECWELPGRNQQADDLTALLAVPGQRAARAAVRTHLVPDWRSVATEYDGVHLSWAGFLTSEGCVTDLGGGDVAMLRYWCSERTLWLNDVVGEPEPAPPPRLLA